jgi:hypothetical protein
MCCIYIFYFLEFIPSGKFKFTTKKLRTIILICKNNHNSQEDKDFIFF